MSPLTPAPDKPSQPRTDARENRNGVLGEADPSLVQRAKESLRDFLNRYSERLQHLFEERFDLNQGNLTRGLPPFALKQIREADPLSAYVPVEHGGRGGSLHESLAVLEATGYESLPLCLMVGINGGLFLQPVAKYGSETVKRDIFRGILDQKRMGGLMITEPEYGTDALNMKTGWRKTEGGEIHIEGTKHWAGLTGWADYWLLTARPRAESGGLHRDIDFFVCDVTQPGQHVEVEEMYNNLGLRMLPYGRNRIDATVPGAYRLEPESTGIKMLLDLLHRSRFQFSGMGMGYLRRIYDEAYAHCRERFVGGKPLLDYDQVRARLNRMQAGVTACAAACLHASEHAGTENNLAGEGLAANAIKTTVTDWMQEAAQSFMQLMGAKGYRQDHLAGRAFVDSRPFQIFEGSNDVLYAQVAEAVAKGMRRMKSTSLIQYLTEIDGSMSRAAESLRESLDFNVDRSVPQRKMVELGEALSRLFSMELTIELGDRGYSPEHVSATLETLRNDVTSRLSSFHDSSPVTLVTDATPGAAWLSASRFNV